MRRILNGKVNVVDGPSHPAFPVTKFTCVEPGSLQCYLNHEAKSSQD